MALARGKTAAEMAVWTKAVVARTVLLVPTGGRVGEIDAIIFAVVCEENTIPPAGEVIDSIVPTQLTSDDAILPGE